jgi:hypothetical protein
MGTFFKKAKDSAEVMQADFDSATNFHAPIVIESAREDLSGFFTSLEKNDIPKEIAIDLLLDYLKAHYKQGVTSLSDTLAKKSKSPLTSETLFTFCIKHFDKLKIKDKDSSLQADILSAEKLALIRPNSVRSLSK